MVNEDKNANLNPIIRAALIEAETKLKAAQLAADALVRSSKLKLICTIFICCTCVIVAFVLLVVVVIHTFKPLLH